MSWFFIALITPVLHAAANHIDKYLLSKYFTTKGVGALIIFSSIFSVIILPFIFFINPNVLSVSYTLSIKLIVYGALTMVAILFYLYALMTEEASIIVPLFQTVPVFGFILGYLFLGEHLASAQLLGSIIIVMGALVLTIELKDKRVVFKNKVVALMLGASFLIALTSVIFKNVAETTGYSTSIFWGLVGKVGIGILFFLCVASYRKAFIFLFKENKLFILGLTSINESIILAGDMVLAYAVLLAPVSLVLVIGNLQPLFVFIFAIILTLFFPSSIQEDISKRALAQKIAGIAVVIIGSYFIL